MKPKRPIFFVSALIVLLLLPSVQSVLAGEVLLEDNFASVDPGWAAPNEYWKVEAGKLIITPPTPNRSFPLINIANVFDNADITVEVMLAEGGDPSHGGGIVFWGKDRNNYYVFTVYEDGRVGIFRLVANRWLNPVPVAPNDAVKKGFGESNTLRVVTKGNQALAYVNDKQVAKNTGQPPEGGGQVGLQGESGEKQNIWQFANFKVTAPQ